VQKLKRRMLLSCTYKYKGWQMLYVMFRHILMSSFKDGDLQMGMNVVTLVKTSTVW